MVYDRERRSLTAGNKVLFHDPAVPEPWQATIISLDDDRESAVIEVRRGIRLEVFASGLSRVADDSWGYVPAAERYTLHQYLICPNCGKMIQDPRDIRTGWCDNCDGYTAREEAQRPTHEGEER